jgi:hypothetical protein
MAKKKEDKRKVWLVAFPTYRYTQDVKTLARKNDLKIIDAKFKDSVNKEKLVEKAPALTLKKEYQPKTED